MRILWVNTLRRAAGVLACGLTGLSVSAGPFRTHAQADRPPAAPAFSVTAAALESYGYSSALPPLEVSCSSAEAEVRTLFESLNPSGTSNRTEPSSLPVDQRPWLVNRPSPRSFYPTPWKLPIFSSIPEPASILLLATGLIGLFARRQLLRERV